MGRSHKKSGETHLKPLAVQGLLQNQKTKKCLLEIFYFGFNELMLLMYTNKCKDTEMQHQCGEKSIVETALSDNIISYKKCNIIPKTPSTGTK